MTMLSRDGDFNIFVIEHESSYSDGKRWALSSFDHFGTPKGFSASDKCWQETGVRGTYNRRTAVAGLQWIATKWPDHSFRLKLVKIGQHSTEVARMSLKGEVELTS